MTHRTFGPIAASIASAVIRCESGIDVHQPRSRPHCADRLGRRDERVRRQDHLVARSDSQRPERQGEGLGPRRDTDREVALGVVGELLLEGLDVVAQREGSLLGDFAHHRQQLLEQSRVVAVELSEGDLSDGVARRCRAVSRGYRGHCRLTPSPRSSTGRPACAGAPAAARDGRGGAGRGSSSPNVPSAQRSPAGSGRSRGA